MKTITKVLAAILVLAAFMMLSGCNKPSSGKKILSFKFYEPEVEATIMESAKTVIATVPEGTYVTALVPIITVSNNATIYPASGIPQNFTSPKTYIVTAEDGTQASYTVTVVIGNGGGNGGGGGGNGYANGHEYVDLGLPSGTLWATCNVGANAPEGYGDYFAWGETTTKDVYYLDTYQFYDGSNLTKYTGSDGLTTLLPEDDAATANWGGDWRIPTREEWYELINNTTTNTRMNQDGRLLTASNGASLFLPAAGFRWGEGIYAGSSGSYWSSSLDTDGLGSAWSIGFGGKCGMYSIDDRGYGRSVRAVLSASKN